MPENEQREMTTRPADASSARQAIEEVTPEQQEWFRLAGFSRIEWQRLVYARWRYRQGLLTDSSQEQ